MAFLYKDFGPTSAYKDSQWHKYGITETDQQVSLRNSATLYVGNLSFYTTEEQIHELFSKCGEIRRIIMGLDKFKKTPCGFCFVEYYTHEDAADCVKYINGTRLDDRVIRTDWDVGFRDGRQYGRGKAGGQVRDEYRSDYDPGRGGYGKQVTPTSSPVVEKKTSILSPQASAGASEVPPTLGASHFNSQFESSEYNWRAAMEGGAKRPRDEQDQSSAKRTKGEEEKNPRFREGKEDSDEDE